MVKFLPKKNEKDKPRIIQNENDYQKLVVELHPTATEENLISSRVLIINVLFSRCLLSTDPMSIKNKAVAILPSTAIYPQRLFCRELFVIGQS